MLKNNKGFTVVELITSFALAMVVFAFLFEIVVTLKDLYINSGYKTELLYKQAMISNKINTTLFQKKIKLAMTCGDNCLFFVFDDSSTSKLQIDKTNNLFTWGDYTTKLVTNSSFGDIIMIGTTATDVKVGRNDSIITIGIPITSANIEGKNFGVNIVYQYDSRTSSIAGINSNEQTDGTKAIYLNGSVDDTKSQGSSYVDPGYFVYYANGSVVYNDSSVTVTSTPTDVLGQSYNITYTIVEGSETVATMTRKVTVVGTYTYNYTGDVQTFTAPIDGYYKVELWGAKGGGDADSGGNGGYTSGNVYLTEGTSIYVYVGQLGITGNLKSTSETSNLALATFNGGGMGGAAGGPYTPETITYYYYFGSSGGGATDIRLVNGNWNDAASLKSRIMVAGGGGANSINDTPNGNGEAGGLLGLKGSTNSLYPTNGGIGGTQLAGYNFGIGGPGGDASISYCGGNNGGGGGYYGGVGGTKTANGDCFIIGGGGGSSFISGYAGVNAITNATSITHSNNTKHYSNNYFLNGQMQAGVSDGSGKAIINYIGKNLYKQNSNLNGVRYIKDCINGSSKATSNQWVELQAIINGTNVAYGKTVTGTSTEAESRPYGNITDGDITSTIYAQASYTGLQCVTVDLGKVYNLDEVAIWHYYNDGRTYNDHTLSVSLNNNDWISIISSTAAETSLGKHYNAYTSG